jgi:hypothetical protein
MRYGASHRRRRAILAPDVAAGKATCSICGRRIDDAGAAWDLAHADDGRTYLGPAHMSCNRGVWGQVNGRAKYRATSRAW